MSTNKRPGKGGRLVVAFGLPADSKVGENVQPLVGVRRGIRHADAATPLPDRIAQYEGRNALRALRLWHWRHAIAATARREDWRTTPATKAQARQAWAFHMGAVQALNDLFPMGDTAEKDDQPGAEFHALTHLRIPA